MRRVLTAILLILCLPAHAATEATDLSTTDPLRSGRWLDVRKEYFGNQAVVFDDRVTVAAPASAEDSMNVPVSVRVTGGLQVRRIIVFAELNPIVKVLEMEPLRAQPYVAFRMKLQQGSPVRAAALDHQGTWHVGGVWVDAAGGGCTAPSAGRASPDWQNHLGEVQSRSWSRQEGGERLRLRITHPMDTGLANGIPAFYLQELTLRDEGDTEYLRISTFEPLSENPVLSFDLPERKGGKLRLTGVDNNGNRIDRVLP